MNLNEFASNIKMTKNVDIYIVGGYVRDELLHKPSHDIDICSSLSPSEIKEKCDELGIDTFPIGMKHGTIAIRLDDSDNLIEHTTFRNNICDDKRYNTNLEKDAIRRDFTINSIYKNIVTGQIIDPNNGINDIKERKINFCGNTQERIKEDYLRMIRFFRFRNRLNFNISDEDLRIIEEEKKNIVNVSKERIRQEINSFLLDYWDLNNNINRKMIEIFSDSNIFFYILNEMMNIKYISKYHDDNNLLDHSFDVYKQCWIWLQGKKHIPDTHKIKIYLCALLHDVLKILCFNTDKHGLGHFIGHSEIDSDEKKELLNKLKDDICLSNDEFNFLKFVIESHNIVKNIDLTKQYDAFTFQMLFKYHNNIDMIRDAYPIYYGDHERKNKRNVFFEKSLKIKKHIPIFKQIYSLYNWDEVSNEIPDKSLMKKYMYRLLKHHWMSNEFHPDFKDGSYKVKWKIHQS